MAAVTAGPGWARQPGRAGAGRGGSAGLSAGLGVSRARRPRAVPRPCAARARPAAAAASFNADPRRGGRLFRLLSGGGGCPRSEAARFLPRGKPGAVRAAVAVALGFGVPAAGGMPAACGMQRCHREALKRNRVMLAKELVLNELLEHLIEKDIVTAEMVEVIQVRRVRSAAAGAVVGGVAGVILGGGSAVRPAGPSPARCTGDPIRRTRGAVRRVRSQPAGEPPRLAGRVLPELRRIALCVAERGCRRPRFVRPALCCRFVPLSFPLVGVGVTPFAERII